jgi:putative DNA primase/helicase
MVVIDFQYGEPIGPRDPKTGIPLRDLRDPRNWDPPALNAVGRIGLADSELDASDAFAWWIHERAEDKFEHPLVGWDPRSRAWWLFHGAALDPANGPRWQRDRMNRVHQLATEFLNIWGAERPARMSARMHAALLHLLQSHPLVVLDPEAWDGNPDLLGTPGGVVDLRTGALRRAYPSDAISKCTAVTPAPEFDEPERWMKFLDEALGGDSQLIDALQKFGGYSLTGHIREHVFLAIVGAGGAGVSTFTNCLMRVAGDYAKATAPETFTATTGDRHPADMAALAGVRLVVAPEVERGRRWAESRLKGFVVGDPVSARVMRGDPFEFRPVGKLIVTSNALPSIGTVDRAMRRRLLIVEFNHVPAQPQRDLLERLIEDEGPAILRWFIDGAVYWYCNGLEFPESMRLATDQYLDVEDSFTVWLEESVVRGVEESETAAALFSSWRQFCEARNEHAGTAKGLSHLLQARGFKSLPAVVDKSSGRRVRGYRGLSVR